MVGSFGLGLRRRAMFAVFRWRMLIEISKVLYLQLAQECCCRMGGRLLELLSIMFVIARCPGD